VQNLVMLPWRAPIDGTGWKCEYCQLPADGALAVVCDRCIESGRIPSRACYGKPEDNQRIKIEQLQDRPFEHLSECRLGDPNDVQDLVCSEEVKVL
jgi:hypothetical protein